MITQKTCTIVAFTVTWCCALTIGMIKDQPGWSAAQSVFAVLRCTSKNRWSVLNKPGHAAGCCSGSTRPYLSKDKASRTDGKQEEILGNWWRTPCWTDKLQAYEIIVEMIINPGGAENDRNMYLLVDHRMVEVHRVAKLAIFRDRLLRRTMRLGVWSKCVVLVPIQYHLSCDKNDQQQPGIDNMDTIFFQQRQWNFNCQ